MFVNGKFSKISILICVLALLAACSANTDGGETINGNIGDPTSGLFEGSTSQGERISLWVDEVDGQMVITSIQYNIKMDAQDWSVSVELVQPDSRNMLIKNGQFSDSDKTGNTAEEVSGKFFGDDGAEGRLRCTNEHPQGLGTAVGDVTFVVYKK